jgi:hypothetical protein
VKYKTEQRRDKIMVKRTIEIEYTLSEIEESLQSDLRDIVIEYLNDNPDLDESPDLYNDIDYNGSFHELVDSSVPIYTGEINDLFYLYGNDFEEAFDNAGIGEKDDEHWPMGWKAAAIYCYLEQEVSEWYENNKEDIYDEWKEQHPDKADDEE